MEFCNFRRFSLLRHCCVWCSSHGFVQRGPIYRKYRIQTCHYESASLFWYKNNMTNLPSQSWLECKFKQYKLGLLSSYRYPDQASLGLRGWRGIRMSDIWMSHVPYEGVISHICCVERLTWNTKKVCEWVMSHMKESCPIWRSHVPYEGVLSHMKESCLIWRVHVPYVWIRHVSYEFVNIYTNGFRV